MHPLLHEAPSVMRRDASNINPGHRAIAVGAIRNSNGGISSSLAADCVFGMASGTGSHADTVLHQVLVARL